MASPKSVRLLSRADRRFLLQSTQLQAGSDQAAGFQIMHFFQCRHGLLLALGEHVLHLAGGHAVYACCLAQVLNQGDAAVAAVITMAGKQLESAGVQGVAGQNGGGFVEGLVAGGLAPAQVVVVHGGQIVVNQE